MEDYTIKIDGEHATFESGAVRNTKTGKGRFDLIPGDVVNAIINRYLEVWNDNDMQNLHDYTTPLIASVYNEDYVSAIIIATFIIGDGFIDGFPVILYDLAHHYEKGAEIYGENNWKKGIPDKSFIDSGRRHMTQWLMGKTDENHFIAFIWNMFGVIWNQLQKDE